MKRKFIAITVLICVLGCLCSCTQKDVTPTSAPTAQQTTEAPKKTLTADEVVALIHDKFDTEKENCRFEEISSGTSVTVYEDGTSEKENTGKTRTAFKKENGKISFLPKAGDRPATPADLNLSPKQDKVLYSLILDGEILYKNLSAIGKDENWLKKQLSLNKTKNVEEIFLAVCDEYDNFTVYKANNDDNKNDIFQ